MAKFGYLLQSRHGVYYFRFVPPARLRQQSPDLPSEIRISLRTRATAPTLFHTWRR